VPGTADRAADFRLPLRKTVDGSLQRAGRKPQGAHPYYHSDPVGVLASVAFELSTRVCFSDVSVLGYTRFGGLRF
jgi:hypothetical protein